MMKTLSLALLASLALLPTVAQADPGPDATVTVGPDPNTCRTTLVTSNTVGDLTVATTGRCSVVVDYDDEEFWCATLYPKHVGVGDVDVWFNGDCSVVVVAYLPA